MIYLSMKITEEKVILKLLIESAKELCIETKACGILLETDKTNEIGNQLYPSCGFEQLYSRQFL